jgi:DNA polymerase-3 subunit epsilon
MLFTPTAQGSGQSPVGLGRSVFAFLDRDQVVHAIDKIQYALDRERDAPVTFFLATSVSGGLVRVRLAPFLSSERLVAGLVLTLEDVTAAFGREAQRRSVLQALATGARQSSANVRAAAENLAGFPDMDDSQRARFTEIVAAESRGLSDTIDAALLAYAEALKSGLSLEDMRVADLLDVVRRRLDALPGVELAPNAGEETLWVRVDSFALTQAFAFLAARLQQQRGLRELALRAQASGGFAAIDLAWRGEPVAGDALGHWETEPLQLGAQQAPLSIHHVLEQHGGEVWHQANAAGELSWFRFLVPLTEPVAPKRRRSPREGRPEYYDFDLFHQSGATHALMGRGLSQLSYTVFDTETTGVEPSAGDKIISIGAVRIVNGRLLKSEVYEQLVDPQRTVPRESVRIHGIESRALAGQPVLREILPGFHRFCEDTVLVAHNAAFDMRFLELAEGDSGVRFTQPVLDTLLLSAVVHPELEDHGIEAIAERLGIAVVGRHTALGDALMTSEIFLKLVPLLAERGIATLGQALDASRETYYVRLQY